MPATKIATCCYCGTRAALQLRGNTKHELACSSCGAPLHDLKMLPLDHTTERRELVRPSPVRAGHNLPASDKKRKGTYKKPKKKKSLKRRFFEEAFDIIEDIFD